MSKTDSWLRAVAAVKVVTYCNLSCDTLQNLHGYIRDEQVLKRVVVIQKAILDIADEYRKEARGPR